MRRIVLVSALALASCAHRPDAPRERELVTTYDCSEAATTEDGSLEASRHRVAWGRDLGDGMHVGLSLDLYAPEDQAGFAARGFQGRQFGHPVIFFDFADRFDDLVERSAVGRSNSPRTRGLSGQTVAGELRIGSRVKRNWMPVNMVIVLYWSELEQMLADPGDLIATLYDKDGTIYQRAAVPRAAFARAEAALKALHARTLAKEADQERLCRREVHEVDDGKPIIT
jgi:hypothetical protein